MSIITMTEPKFAPFDLFSSERDCSLIPESAIDDLQNLNWEATVVKNYCLAVNQQTNLRLEALPRLPKIQEKSRQTASIWLKNISPAINSVYSTTGYFCDAFSSSSEKLIELAKDMASPSNKELFAEEIKGLKDEVREINKKINFLNKRMNEIRLNFETDVRNFDEIIQEAKKIEAGNQFKIKSLEDEINELKDQIKDLNKKIAITASVGTIGMLAFIISVVVTVATGGLGAPAIVGGVIGLTAGVSSYTKLEQFNSEIKKKKANYKIKNEDLQKIQAETATAIAIQKQYEPLRDSIQVVQNLFEGWSEILDSFDRFLKQVTETGNTSSDKIAKQVENLDNTVKKISEVIQSHKERALIKSYLEGPVASMLKPYYGQLTSAPSLYLPTSLHLAYTTRMHSHYASLN
ncbi:HBL/NHE enterotoxin family protein [Rickettsiella massiliensis]|uniref:HBL/NHE enterotoxin family protein n=1 Tax=Rickettsiella massiliensis TaxID=676517 RepID=UPI000299D858|nr:HBL/NHE enterotoxin family protein [Rickettsiella massiliensis]